MADRPGAAGDQDCLVAERRPAPAGAAPTPRPSGTGARSAPECQGSPRRPSRHHPAEERPGVPAERRIPAPSHPPAARLPPTATPALRHAPPAHPRRPRRSRRPRLDSARTPGTRPARRLPGEPSSRLDSLLRPGHGREPRPVPDAGPGGSPRGAPPVHRPPNRQPPSSAHAADSSKTTGSPSAGLSIWAASDLAASSAPGSPSRAR